LIGNAFKFTEKGRISVKAELDTKLPKGNYVLIRMSVSDTGIGIDQEKQAHIFESFSQADDSTSRKYGGTGLGLSISKNLVDLMGGELTLNSEKNKGSCFSFTIVLKVEKETDRAALKTFNKFRDKRLLIVDSHGVLSEFTKEITASFGLIVDLATTGQQATTQLETASQNHKPYHGVIIDTVLSDMSGLELTQRLYEHSTLSNAPCALMTSHEHSIDNAAVHMSNLQHQLRQPLVSTAVLDGISCLIESKACAQPSHSTTESFPDYSACHALVVEDNTVNQLVITGLLQQLNITPLIANNGQEGIDLYLATEKPFNIILMDCEMPVLDGYQATSKIRELESKQPHNTLIIACSAYVMDSQKQKAFDHGVDDYLCKPVKTSELVAMFEKHHGRLIAHTTTQLKEA